MLKTNAYKELLANYAQLKDVSLLDLFAADSDRAAKFSLKWQGINCDFSKNNITEEVLTNLMKLSHEMHLSEQIRAMFSGEKINNTEHRAALHTALRAKNVCGMDASEPLMLDDGTDIMPDIKRVLQQMKKFSDDLHQGIHLGCTGEKITDIVNIGIGGSDLGPVCVCAALKPYRKNNLKVHFVSSVDGYQIIDVLSTLNPKTTLFVVVSKTFTTEETMTNARYARQWFLDKTGMDSGALKRHFVASSTNVDAVTAFGIDSANMFEFWDFVGGRYSLWSAVGLTIALYIGFDNFQELLSGGQSMDEHFLTTTDLRQNLPVLLALISVWYINFYEYTSEVILPYNTRLSHFPAYIQQQQMESNGKAVDKAGNKLPYRTCPIIWGGSGINAQHAYFQLLHQGTSINPVDFIIAAADKYTNSNHNDILLANVIAQAEAFMCGKTEEVAKDELLAAGVEDDEAKFLAKHKTFVGNRPSNMIVMPELSPFYVGALIALYEHKTFVQGVVWDINSFDQWGVELGKKLARIIFADMTSKEISAHDASTTKLIEDYIEVRDAKI